MAGAFRYVPPIEATLDPWKDQLGEYYYDVLARLADRDRQLEDFLADLGTWGSFTPVWSNITVGNGISTGQYTKIGTTVHFTALLAFGSTTAVTGDAGLTPPVPARNPGGGVGRFTCAAQYLQAAAREWVGVGHLKDVTDLILLRHTESGNAGNVNATNPFTWTTAHEIRISGTYEAAS